MSDTPRTDAACNIYDLQIVAEDIERELNASTSEIERLTAKVAQLYEGAEEQKQRIKLLKITGDELLEWLKDGTIADSNYRLLANAWQRAKENKQ